MKILVVGGGGREHAIIMKLAESPKVDKLYCTPGNGGISKYAECFDVAATDVEGVVALAEKLHPDMVVVAPDDPLVLGMVDALQAKGFKTFGPKANAAIIEGSKVFSKEPDEKVQYPDSRLRGFYRQRIGDKVHQRAEQLSDRYKGGRSCARQRRYPRAE